MAYCTQCGAEVTPEMKFCGNCGAPLAQGEQQEEAYPRPSYLTDEQAVPPADATPEPDVPEEAPQENLWEAPARSRMYIIAGVATFVVALLIVALVVVPRLTRRSREGDASAGSSMPVASSTPHVGTSSFASGSSGSSSSSSDSASARIVAPSGSLHRDLSSGSSSTSASASAPASVSASSSTTTSASTTTPTSTSATTSTSTSTSPSTPVTTPTEQPVIVTQPEPETEPADEPEGDEPGGYVDQPDDPAPEEYHTADKPDISDFDWFRDDMAAAPGADATALSKFFSIQGGWKGYIYNNPAIDNVGALEQFLNVVVGGTDDDVWLTLYWYRSRNAETGDEWDSNTPETVYRGTCTDGHIDVQGAGEVHITSFWLEGGHEYATGYVSWPDATDGIIALVRP